MKPKAIEKIKNMFDINFKYIKETFVLFILVILHNLLNQVVSLDIDLFRKYMSDLVSSDIYMAITFTCFWTLIYAGIILLGGLCDGINHISNILLVASIFVPSGMARYIIFIALVVIAIGIILKISKHKNNKDKISTGHKVGITKKDTKEESK